MTDGDRSGGRGGGSSVVERSLDPEGFFRAALEECAYGVFVADGDGRIVFANAALEDVLGYDPGGLVNVRLSTIVDDSFDGRPDGDPVELRTRDAAGNEITVSLSVADYEHAGEHFSAGIVRDVSERRERRRELERYQTVLEAVDDGIYVLDSDFRILDVNEAVTSMTGYPRAELVGAHASRLVDDDVLEEAAALSRELLQSDRDAASIRAQLRTADGERLPIETRFSLYPFDDGSYGQVGVVRDITERKRFEETLTALHDSTRELLGAKTNADICELIAATATDVADRSAAAVYLLDPGENALRPRAVSRGPGERVGDVPDIRPGEDACWDAFVENETVTVEDESASALPIVPATCIPLGDRGLFVAGAADSEAAEDDVATVLNLLAASTEAALDRVGREEELRERDRELQERNRRLRRIDRINEIIRDIGGAMVQADSVTEIRREVCDRLIESEWFDFAWIGTADPGADEIQPRAWAGDERGYLDTVSLALDGDTTEPAVRATNAEQPIHVANVSADIHADDWRKAAASRDFRSVVSIPLQYGEFTYGVLTAYANRHAAIDDTIRTVLGELGEIIANAMNSVETKQTLLTDSVVELEMRFDAPEDVLFRLAQATSCRLQFESVVRQSDGGARIFFTTDGVDPDRVSAFGERSVGVDGIRLVTEREETCLFEADVVEPSLASLLVDHGAAVRSLDVDDRGMRIVVDLRPNADVRTFVELIRSQYPDAELLGRHRHERPVRTRTGIEAHLEERLTERQLEILQIAYYSGYFEWPRESNGEEIADSLGVSQPTINRHLRVAERNLLAILFDER